MSEIIVLDTHIWLWAVNGNLERMPPTWLDRIRKADRVGISPVSCYEVTLANKKGRLELPISVDEWLEAATSPSLFEIFPLTARIALGAVNLSPIHKDPFDRIIIATAIAYNAKLASIDKLFFEYDELKGRLLITLDESAMSSYS